MKEDNATQKGAALPRNRLTVRHIQFIAIGGAIGAGLFLGSGEAVHRAGPILLAAYLICGGVIFLIGRALGELALHRPEAGSFIAYAEEYLGARVGFMTGWSYWLNWILVGIAEISAVGVFARFWVPDLPQWIPALAAVLLLYWINLRSVRMFGELEFWLSFVKVLTILSMIGAGIGVLVLHVGPAGATASLANLWRLGGWLPHGWIGLLAAIPTTLFAFGGIELIGMTAADTLDPERSLPRAINGVVFRILVFYVGSLTIIMAIVPWTELSAATSPYVLAFSRIGLPAASAIINVVVITAVLSSCNSGIYATGRALQRLAAAGHAPRFLEAQGRQSQPIRAISASAACMLVGVYLNYLIPGKIFGIAMSAVAVLLASIWSVIILCHLAYRRKVRAGQAPQVRFRMPGSPVTNWAVFLFLALVVAAMPFQTDSRLAFWAAGVWFAGLAIGYQFIKGRWV